MNSSEQHYAGHLASYYSWSVGGAPAAIARAEAELTALGVELSYGARVLDLGAGFGAHAIALARRGARVTAVDTSSDLLEELHELAEGLEVTTVAADIVAWIEEATDSFDAVLCMGDTLTHLASSEHARRLLEAAAARLAPRGTLLVTLRDYTRAELGSDFHVVVRSEPERIATCVVEHRPEGVLVRDLLHEYVDSNWHVRTSRYVKLRLAPLELSRWLEGSGLSLHVTDTAAGMVALKASRGNPGTVP